MRSIHPCRWYLRAQNKPVRCETYFVCGPQVSSPPEKHRAHITSKRLRPLSTPACVLGGTGLRKIAVQQPCCWTRGWTCFRSRSGLGMDRLVASVFSVKPLFESIIGTGSCKKTRDSSCLWSRRPSSDVCPTEPEDNNDLLCLEMFFSLSKWHWFGYGFWFCCCVFACFLFYSDYRTVHNHACKIIF